MDSVCSQSNSAPQFGHTVGQPAWFRFMYCGIGSRLASNHVAILRLSQRLSRSGTSVGTWAYSPPHAVFALMLAVVGAVILGVAALQLWEGRARPTPRCAMPTPDGSRACADEAGHLGWHHTIRARWFGAVWAPPAAVRPDVAPRKRPAPKTSAAPAKAAAAVLERSAATTPAPLGGEPLKFRVGAFGTRRPAGFQYR